MLQVYTTGRLSPLISDVLALHSIGRFRSIVEQWNHSSKTSLNEENSRQRSYLGYLQNSPEMDVSFHFSSLAHRWYPQSTSLDVEKVSFSTLYWIIWKTPTKSKFEISSVFWQKRTRSTLHLSVRFVLIGDRTVRVLDRRWQASIKDRKQKRADLRSCLSSDNYLILTEKVILVEYHEFTFSASVTSPLNLVQIFVLNTLLPFKTSSCLSRFRTITLIY